MKVNRRSFIKGSSVAIGSLLLQGNLIVPTINTSNNLKKIRNNVGIYSEKGGTIGWFVNGDSILVIDAQFPDSAENFKNSLNSKSNHKINFLINTHHHNDHTMGNYYLKDYSENIIAHNNCPRLQLKHNKGKSTEDKVVTANVTFNDSINIELPDEKVKAQYLGIAHTSGDIVVHFENSNVAHLGDLVFNNVYPYIDNNAECSVANWIIVLEKIEKYFDNDTKFIFGHANDNDAVIGSISDITRKRNYLEALLKTVEKHIKDGKSIDQIESSNLVPGFEAITELWDGARKMNLRATAEQLLNSI